MEHLSWLTFTMLILASYRLTHLIVFDKITEFIRKPFMKKKQTVDEQGHVETKKVPKSNFGYLLNCYWCAGIWCALIIAVGYLIVPKTIFPLILILSVAGGQAILETLVGVATKLVSFFSDLKK
ncbi:DUF1360 domain-containing protein [Bacillus sp. GM2]|uniref:DUF1360 domain-containing protein n=1 Tax=Bacillus paralicheniformis TaxID=1648923 RepID=A0AAW6K6K3_9BACI|nr:DUF1360 domain-containing protein [Bacillus paralicheniformis]MDE1451435.1 DUF1360 domain-containing protein [Bacillus paralicheniformis]OPF73042.1 hypothetical protein BVF99_14105 [Bacillus paralicheniformis]TWM35540.1 Sporulation protein YjcA [Bacillus paralicheniformis]UWS62793.1 DUF1360 domain-containing protein [Bacillus paralicheniformis]